jgi:hypothetical protein
MHLGTSREQTVSRLGIFGSQECNIYYFQLLNAPFFIYYYSQSTFSPIYLLWRRVFLFFIVIKRRPCKKKSVVHAFIFINSCLANQLRDFFFLFAKAELTRRILLIILRSDHSNKCRDYVFVASDFVYYELIS